MTGYLASAKYAIAAALVIGAVPVKASNSLYPSDSVVLFVASWCAPCRDELARLDEIERAASPRTVWVVAIDDDPRTRAMLRTIPPMRIWRPTPAAWLRIRDDLSTRTSGLPFSLATDRTGRPCSESRRGLDAARTRTMTAPCAS